MQNIKIKNKYLKQLTYFTKNFTLQPFPKKNQMPFLYKLDMAIKKLALAKPLGQDGLFADFYTFFWADIK